MKKLNIKGIQKFGASVGKFLKKNGPSMKVYGGVIAMVVGAGFGCKAAIEIDKELTAAKDKINDIKENPEEHENPDQEIKDIKKHTAFVIVKKAALSVGLVGGGAISTLDGFGSIKKTAKELGLAYSTLSTAFGGYRNAVIERFGEEVDKELRYGKAKQVIVPEKSDTDENGVTTVTAEHTANVLDPEKLSKDIYTFRFSRQTSRMFNKHNMDYNLMFVRSIEAWANEQLRLFGTNIVSRDLEELGIKPTAVSAVMGWVNDTTLSGFNADHQISFGIDWNNPYSSVFYDELTGEEYILLNMNVDGSVIEWLDIPKENICYNRKSKIGSIKDFLLKSKLKTGIPLSKDETEALDKGIAVLSPEEVSNIRRFA